MVGVVVVVVSVVTVVMVIVQVFMGLNELRGFNITRVEDVGGTDIGGMDEK